MKSDFKKNLWDIVKYILTLGVSAVVNVIKRRRAKKQTNSLDKAEICVPVDSLPPCYIDTTTDSRTNAEIIQRSIDRVVKRYVPVKNNDK